jgi:voltage-gated potassium channel
MRLIKFKPIRELLKEGSLNYIIFLIGWLILISGELIYLIESVRPESNIKTLGNAFWWAFATITTVGYGDYYPVTHAGKVVGVLLMVLGISAFFILTAKVASLLVKKQEEKEFDKVNKKLEALEKKLNRLLKNNNP